MLGISISGGGALGIGPAYYLSLAEANGIDWKKHVHFYAGTSTGSILASALAVGLTGDDIYCLYRKSIVDVFSKYPWYKRIFNRRLPKYNNENLISTLDTVFGLKRICELENKLYVPSFVSDRDNAEKVFDNEDSEYLSNIIASSCSAPTYFSPYGERKNMCDGGLFANDPVAVLACGMKKENVQFPKILSFVTTCSVPDDLDNCGDKSLIEWLLFLIDNVVARTGSYNYHLAQQLVGKGNILRLSPMVDKRRKMDDTSEKNIAEVLRIWENYFNDTKELFVDFLES